MILGIDVGGSKTLIAPLNDKGEILHTFRFPTPDEQEDFVTMLIANIKAHCFDEELDAIVVGVPAIVQGNIPQTPPNLHWQTFDLAGVLEREFKVPVWCENDANLAGLSEVRRRQPWPQVALYLTLSTDIGSGVITNGVIDPAFAHSEAGHMMLEYDGRVQRWGSFASGGALKRLHGKYAAEIHSQALWDEHAAKIAHGLLALLPVVQPELLIIGGSLGTYFEKYQSTLEKILEAQLSPVVARPRIEKALNPEEAVVYGCYYLATLHLAAQKDS